MSRSPRRDDPPQPPAGLSPATPGEWMRVWTRVRTTPAVKLTGAMAAYFAGYGDGADIRPGTVILAAVCGEMNEKTARTALGQIRDWGLIWRYSEGRMQGRNGMADVYRLTIPDDLTDRVPLLTPQYKVPGTPDMTPGDPVDNSTPEPVDNPPEHRASHPEITQEHRASGPRTPGLRSRNTGPETRSPNHVPNHLPSHPLPPPVARGPVEGTRLAAAPVDEDPDFSQRESEPDNRPAGLTDAQWAEIAWLAGAQQQILTQGNHRR